MCTLFSMSIVTTFRLPWSPAKLLKQHEKTLRQVQNAEQHEEAGGMWAKLLITVTLSDSSYLLWLYN